MEGMEQNAVKNPNKVLEVQRLQDARTLRSSGYAKSPRTAAGLSFISSGLKAVALPNSGILGRKSRRILSMRMACLNSTVSPTRERGKPATVSRVSPRERGRPTTVYKVRAHAVRTLSGLHAHLAGPTVPARGDLGRGRRQLRPVLRARHQGRAVPVRLRRRRRRSRTASRCPSTPTRSGTATCPTCCPASSTATASTARTTRRTGIASTRNKVVLDPYAKAIGRDVRWDDSLFGYTIGDPAADLSFDERDSAAVRAAGVGRRHGVHLGRRPAAAHALAQDAHLRAARQGLHQAAPGRAREAPRHLRRPGLRGGDPAPAQTWASRPSSCCRSTTTSTTGTWSRRG